ncbi:MAG: hypothetical protein ACTSYD_03370 [Candidatus Heimdallarchaeaceae archaeon]
MKGHIIYQKEIASTNPKVSLDKLDTEWINTTTIMYGTEEGVVLWNYYTNKQVLYPNIKGHHEYEYNPVNQTIFTFDEYTYYDEQDFGYNYDILSNII